MHLACKTNYCNAITYIKKSFVGEFRRESVAELGEGEQTFSLKLGHRCVGIESS